MSDQSTICPLVDRGRGNDNAAEVDTASLIWANYAIAEVLVDDRDGSDLSGEVREGLGYAQRAIARMLCDRLNEGAMQAAVPSVEPTPPPTPPRLVVDNA